MRETSLFRRFMDRLMLSLLRSLGRELGGIRVTIFVHVDEDLEAAFAKFESAIELLRIHDRRAADVLRRAANGILVLETESGLAEYSPSRNLVVFQMEYVTDPETSAADLASVLVHEATHAWMHHAGFEYVPERRQRMEAICIRREMRLARRLPDAAQRLEELQSCLSRSPDYLSDAEFRSRRTAMLDRAGPPLWMQRLFRLR